ncbi:Uncharacterized protein APZ42_013168 [Daphnia magna]|uniref:Uncharacterized protein n=1 Tax=Daphnia magna TaxID=35525 RepID=A0A162R2F7_9CRUS|nr:Uncharacterized protein APZ42_013168 [Daphnia magna]
MGSSNTRGFCIFPIRLRLNEMSIFFSFFKLYSNALNMALKRMWGHTETLEMDRLGEIKRGGGSWGKPAQSRRAGKINEKKGKERGVVM